MSLSNLVTQALTGDGVSPEMGQQILTQAIASGASAADLAQLAAQAGVPIPESEIQEYINHFQLKGNLAETGSVNDTYTVVPTSQPNPSAQQTDTDTGPTSVYGEGNGSPGNAHLSPAQWAQVEQENVDYLNSIYNSVATNANIYLPDGSSQTVNYGRIPDYREYIQSHPDLLADFNSPENPFSDMAAFGKWHWENKGKYEGGRELTLSTPQDMGLFSPEVRVQLSPQEQAIYDTNQRTRSALAAMSEEQLGRVYENMSKPIESSHLYDPSHNIHLNELSEITTKPTAGGLFEVADAMVSRAQPFLDRKREDMRERLMVEGHNPGNESWEYQMDDFNRAENDFYLGAMERAGAEQQRLFDMEGRQRQQDMSEQVQKYSMGKDWRQQVINEDLAARNLPLNELNALRTGTQIGLPNMTPYQGQTFSAPDFAGAEQETYNRGLFEQQRSDNKRNSLVSGLGSLFGTAIGGFATGGGFDNGLFSGARSFFG